MAQSIWLTCKGENCSCKDTCMYFLRNETYEGLKKNYGTHARLGQLVWLTDCKEESRYLGNFDKDKINSNNGACGEGIRWWRKVKKESVDQDQLVGYAMKSQTGRDYLAWAFTKHVWAPNREQIEHISKTEASMAVRMAPWYFHREVFKQFAVMNNFGGGSYPGCLFPYGWLTMSKENINRLLRDINYPMYHQAEMCINKYGESFVSLLTMSSKFKIASYNTGSLHSFNFSKKDLIRFAKTYNRWDALLGYSISSNFTTDEKVEFMKRITNAVTFSSVAGYVGHDVLQAYLNRNKK